MLTWLGSGSALLTRCAANGHALGLEQSRAGQPPAAPHTRLSLCLGCVGRDVVAAVASAAGCDGAVSGSSNEAVTNLFGRLLLCQVSHVTKYAESLIKGSEGAPECDVKGLTSTWALADGGLVFCEVTAVKNEWLFVSSAYSCLVPCA